jgi:peptidyl-prolyl cis-trans isomerase A (cyclophilin A)
MRLLFWLLLTTGLTAANLPAGSLVEFRIHRLGSFEVELYDADKPVTVSNFLRYVTSGRWTNMFVHRCAPHFVFQGGGFRVTNRFGANPGLSRVPSFGAITNEFGVGRQFSNEYGTIAMARVGGQTNSATTDWFINLADNVGLDFVDGGFTVFGRVVSGFEVLDLFQTFSGSNSQTNLIFSTVLAVDGTNTLFAELPVLSSAATYSNDLVYADVVLKRLDMALKVRALPNGSREISWNSFSNRVNSVEFVTSLTATNWQLLTNVTGNGQRLTVTDPSPDSNRFYRVRLPF